MRQLVIPFVAERARALRDKGLSAQQIAKALGVGLRVILDALAV